MISQPAIMNATIFPVDFSFFTLGRGSYSAEPVPRKRATPCDAVMLFAQTIHGQANLSPVINRLLLDNLP
jgi:hypothetical protein